MYAFKGHVNEGYMQTKARHIPLHPFKQWQIQIVCRESDYSWQWVYSCVGAKRLHHCEEFVEVTVCRSVTDIANACLQCVVDTILYTRVEWFSIFFEFWKPTHFCRSGIYSGTQFQKIGNFGRARAWRTHDKVLIFKKSVTLKINTFFENL